VPDGYIVVRGERKGERMEGWGKRIERREGRRTREVERKYCLT